MLNKILFPEYTVDYISNVMSLRIPQKRSVSILDSILQEIELSKNTDLIKAQRTINDVYPIFKEFEHDFMSIAFH